MKTASRRETILLISLILWILFVFGGYYYYHKPISLDMMTAPLRALLDMFFVVLFAGLAGGVGRRLLPADSLPVLERCALQFALGAGVISLVWFLFGLLGLYRIPLSAPLLLIGVFVLRGHAVAWYKCLFTLKVAWQRAGAIEKVLALLVLVLVLYQMLIALAPPIKWDALTYHLQLPRQYLAAGRFIFVPDNPYWGHPQLAEMLYTFAMSFHRAETAALLGWSVGVVFLVGLFGFTNTQLSHLRGSDSGVNAGWMAVAAVMAGATFRYLLAWSYNDLFSALFGLAALITFFRWLEQEQQPSWFLWSALFIGMAISIKWTSGVLFLGIFTATLVLRSRNMRSRRLLISGMLITLLTVAPWLVKNLLVTGNPIFPYFFASPGYDAARLAAADLAPKTVDWWLHIFLPFTTTWTGVDSAAGFSADLGPILLLFALPGFMLYWRDSRAKTLAILLGFTAFGLGIASLRFGHLMQTRLYYVALPALAVACGWGWDWIQRQVLQGVRLRRIFSAVVLLAMILIVWQDSFFVSQLSPLSVSLGTQTRQEYLGRTMGTTMQAMQTLEALPDGSKTLMLWEPRGLYAPFDASADLWIDRWYTDRREQNTPPAILQRWKSQGYTHMLLFTRGVEFYGPKPGDEPGLDWLILEEMQAMLPKPTSIGETYLLYSLQ